MSELPAQPEANDPKPSELVKTIYVRRSNGEVSTMRIAENAKTGEDGKLRAYDVKQNNETGKEYVASHKPIASEVLTDEMQVALGAEYGAKNVPEQVEQAGAVRLTEAQEEVADVAIEDVLGLSNPEDAVDGDARMLGLEEHQQRRVKDNLETEVAAAARIMGEPAQPAEAAPLPATNAAEAGKVEWSLQSDTLNSELNLMIDGLSRTDHNAVWLYASSINLTEEYNAKDKLSPNFEESNPGLLKEYKAKFKLLRALRVKAGILDK
jgi:hypothetical protein